MLGLLLLVVILFQGQRPWNMGIFLLRRNEDHYFWLFLDIFARAPVPVSPVSWRELLDLFGVYE